ncbi:MAG TPA: hypothetical protein VIG99_23800 [Myxococcaceae bacterium]|jgi:hypothetical protein
MNTATKLLTFLAVLSSPMALASQPTVPTTADSRIQLAPPDGEVPRLPGPVDGGNPRKTVLSFQPVPMVAGMAVSLLSPGYTVLTLPVDLEYAPLPNVSVSLMLAPMYLETPEVAAGGFQVNGGVRLYPFGRAPDGFWLGAQAAAMMLMTESSGGVAFDLQPQLGYQWVHQNGLTIGVGVGLSVNALANRQFPVTLQVPVGFAW